ncbi:hypothetical protein BsWGS_25998 [Bradybaena similaris]
MLLPAVCVLVVFPALVSPAPVIQLPLGRVQGTDKLAQASQKPYVAFYGIPFAEPPVNELRFKPPQPFVGTGADVVISSSKFRPACLQMFPNTSKVMDEDCLYLNVFTPPDVTKPRKVMVWIHGGAFVVGDATQYVPSQLVTDKDVIVVTIQYRLGIFGFLNTQKGEANNGLRDQILALKWTKDNIHAFGGDATDITIFGQSAGSASVSFLSLSPLTKGLFTKAIMQSGTILSGWALNRNPSVLLSSVAGQLGCTSLLRQTSSSETIDCIRNKTISELLSVDTQGESLIERLNTNNQFLPTIDGDVLPRSPESLLANATYLRINGVLDRDYIVGFTNNEGLIIYSISGNPAAIDSLTQPAAAEEFIREASSLASPTAIDPSKLELLFYQYSYPRDAEGHTPIQNLLDITTDVMFGIATVNFARALTAASNRTNVYLYLFDHYPQLISPEGPLRGSTHGLDLCYEFDIGEITQLSRFYALPPQPSEKNLTELILTALSQFAKTGSPHGPSGQEPRDWLPFDHEDEHFFRISLSPKSDEHVFAKRMALWTDLVLKSSSKVPSLLRALGMH